MNLSPEVYQAYALVKTGAVLLGTIPCVLFVPLLTPVIVILAVLLYFQEMQKADERLKAKRDEIEAQLPRLVATIEQELKSGRNVVGMLERFRMNAGESLSGELDILIADMRSSNYEAALTRFESRMRDSPMLSDVVRGLMGVLRGDDSAVYFQMLSHDFKQIELQRLKAEAQKIPPEDKGVFLCDADVFFAHISYDHLLCGNRESGRDVLKKEGERWENGGNGCGETGAGKDMWIWSFSWPVRDAGAGAVCAGTPGVCKKTAAGCVCYRAGAGSGNFRSGGGRNRPSGGKPD